MGADYYAYAAVLEASVDLAALPDGGGAGEDGALYRCRCEVFAYVRKVLLCKHFRRRHDAGLVAVAHGDETAQHGHHGLARAHVALQQAVHLMAAHHVGADLLDHPLLRTCEAVRQAVVAGVEISAHAGHLKPFLGTRAYVFLLQQAQLQEEEFLEFQPAGGLFQRIRVRREMDVLQRVLQRAETELADEVFREGLGDLVQAEGKRGRFQPAHHLAGDAAVLELLGAGIDAREAALHGAVLLRGVHLRMDHVVAAVEFLRLAEEYEFRTQHEPLVIPFYAFEKYHFHPAGAVVHDDAEALGSIEVQPVPGLAAPAALLDFAKDGDRLAVGIVVALRQHRAAGAVKGGLHHPSPDLHRSEGGVDSGDALQAAAVYIAERIEMYEVAEGAQSEFALEQLRALGTDTRQVLYARVQFTHSYKYTKNSGHPPGRFCGYGEKTLTLKSINNNDPVMKKLITILGALVLLLNPFTANAQAADAQKESYATKNEINLTYGTITAPQGVQVFGSVFAVIFSLGNANMSDVHLVGAAGLEYFRRLGNVVAVGGIGTYENIWGKVKNKEGEITGDINVSIGSLMPAAKFYWFEKPKFNMYSKVAVGASLYGGTNSDSPEVSFAYQLSPVGLTTGGTHHRFMAELGLLGMQGSVLIGYSYRF